MLPAPPQHTPHSATRLGASGPRPQRSAETHAGSDSDRHGAAADPGAREWCQQQAGARSTVLESRDVLLTSKRAKFQAAAVRASQLFRRQRDASLAHLTPDEIAMHPRGHALLEAP